ncbi:MAG TPA: rRNA maturation RNase YbeY [Gemmatimonadota bacterium]|nr:rRNA maturation RNase YbeY [Gemmatimonadota bacterium]
MTLRVHFHPLVALPPDLEPFPAPALAELLKVEGLAAAGAVHCVLTDDVQLTDLNRRFRGRAGPTDVLAFPYPPSESGGVLGDIYVSIERAASQAGERGESVAREVWRLFVHGALHLAGRGHETPASGRRMREIQEAWVSRVYPRR